MITEKDRKWSLQIIEALMANGINCGDVNIFILDELMAEFRTETLNKLANDFRMDELDAVMISVDKWLTGDALKNNPATRASDAREVALKAIESETLRANRAENALNELINKTIKIETKEFYELLNSSFDKFFHSGGTNG